MYTLLANVDLEQQVSTLAVKTVLLASAILLVCTLIAYWSQKNKKVFKKAKVPLFFTMTATLVLSTATLFGSTIYLNQKAESKGPVHWHSEIEFWACGTELDLRNPTGKLSNKIGTSTYHEHNDKHIHLEGVVVRKSEDASLEKFMRVTGGYIEQDMIGIPLSSNSAEWFAQADDDKLDGDTQGNLSSDTFNQYVINQEKGSVLNLRNGATCNGAAAELQTFVYTYNKENNTYSQTKLSDPSKYIMRNESSLGPPSDCVIVEFDSPKSRTNKLCQQYGVKDEKRCVEFGVKSYTPKLCNIKEVQGSTE